VAIIEAEKTLELAAKCLGCDKEALRAPITRKIVTVVGESTEVPFTIKAAAQASQPDAHPLSPQARSRTLVRPSGRLPLPMMRPDTIQPLHPAHRSIQTPSALST
tara:strand:+ start:1097 stop:1411 length:315 start_codon:yes stop_codon:yes gene_type:complete